MNYRIKNRDWETENCEIAAKQFENTSTWFAFFVVGTTANFPVAYLKGWHKSESSLMTCEAKLHCWVSRMASPILSPMPATVHHVSLQVELRDIGIENFKILVMLFSYSQFDFKKSPRHENSITSAAVSGATQKVMFSASACLLCLLK